MKNKKKKINEWQTQQDDFANWVGMWEKAQEDPSFKAAPKPPQPNHGGGDFFGQYPAVDHDAPPEPNDHEYWKQVYLQSMGQGDAPDVAAPTGFGMIQEQKQKIQKKAQQQRVARKSDDEQPRKKKRSINEEAGDKKIGDVAKRMARSANPIYYYSAGKDQEPRVTPNWTDGKELTELHDLKVKLHQLEGKLNAMIGEGKPDKSVRQMEQELRKLRDRLDELSDSLSGGWGNEQD